MAVRNLSGTFVRRRTTFHPSIPATGGVAPGTGLAAAGDGSGYDMRPLTGDAAAATGPPPEYVTISKELDKCLSVIDTKSKCSGPRGGVALRAD